MEQKEIVVDETVVGEQQFEPFDWEEHLYEAWLEEQREQKRNRPADAGL